MNIHKNILLGTAALFLAFTGIEQQAEASQLSEEEHSNASRDRSTPHHLTPDEMRGILTSIKPQWWFEKRVLFNNGHMKKITHVLSKLQLPVDEQQRQERICYLSNAENLFYEFENRNSDGVFNRAALHQLVSVYDILKVIGDVHINPSRRKVVLTKMIRLCSEDEKDWTQVDKRENTLKAIRNIYVYPGQRELKLMDIARSCNGGQIDNTLSDLEIIKKTIKRTLKQRPKGFYDYVRAILLNSQSNADKRKMLFSIFNLKDDVTQDTNSQKDWDEAEALVTDYFKSRGWYVPAKMLYEFTKDVHPNIKRKKKDIYTNIQDVMPNLCARHFELLLSPDYWTFHHAYMTVTDALKKNVIHNELFFFFLDRGLYNKQEIISIFRRYDLLLEEKIFELIKILAPSQQIAARLQETYRQERSVERRIEYYRQVDQLRQYKKKMSALHEEEEGLEHSIENMKKNIRELTVGRLQQSYRQEHVIQELLNQYNRQVEQLHAYQKKMKELKKKEGRLNHKIDNTKKSIDESIYVLTKVLD